MARTNNPSHNMLGPDIPRQLAEQSDRGAAIIGASFVEHYLERLLLARMRPLSEKRRRSLFEGFGPLAGFSSKAEIAFAFNLIGEKTRGDLEIIRSIRNKFAHEILGGEWSFSHPWMVQRCNALCLVDLMGAPFYLVEDYQTEIRLAESSLCRSIFYRASLMARLSPIGPNDIAQNFLPAERIKLSSTISTAPQPVAQYIRYRLNT